MDLNKMIPKIGSLIVTVAGQPTSPWTCSPDIQAISSFTLSSILARFSSSDRVELMQRLPSALCIEKIGTRSSDRVPQILVEHTGFEPVTSTMRM